MTRRGIIQTLSGAAVGGLVLKSGLASPDAEGIYAPGNMLNYVAHRGLFGGAQAREFQKSQISSNPFANGRPLKDEAYLKHQAAGFADWKLDVGGDVAKPVSLSIADLRAMPATTQITQLVCEEGWSYIAEWTGVKLSDILTMVSAKPSRYVAFECIQAPRKESTDFAEAWHPQTIVAYAMNGRDIPMGHGGPLRLRVPRQLGYKSLKFLNRVTVTDSLEGKRRKSPYAWYAGI